MIYAEHSWCHHYVSVRDPDDTARFALLAGPFRTRQLAEKWVDRCRKLASDRFSNGHWLMYGTARIVRRRPRPGMFNTLLGLKVEQLSLGDGPAPYARNPLQDATLDRANAERHRTAAAVQVARVRDWLAELGELVPPQLRAAGELRIAHPHATLAQLGELHTPPLTKDAIASRLRRLLNQPHPDPLPTP